MTIIQNNNICIVIHAINQVNKLYNSSLLDSLMIRQQKNKTKQKKKKTKQNKTKQKKKNLFYRVGWYKCFLLIFFFTKIGKICPKFDRNHPKSGKNFWLTWLTFVNIFGFFRKKTADSTKRGWGILTKKNLKKKKKKSKNLGWSGR